jgi:tetratricopeptide (TPR) repeat protein/predicted Ser/Thr protein kinase
VPPSSDALPPEDLQFADLIVDQGLCSRERVDECVQLIHRLADQGVTPLPRLPQLLVRKGYLAPSDATLRPCPASDSGSADLKLPADVARAAEDPARLLGKYVKVSPLGSGGMGQVWKGWDRELGRWVALKFLHQSDPNQEARLRREAQTAAALNHPHIASVYEVSAKDGAPFIAMQYIEGETLATFSRKDRRALVALLRDAALAVRHAHEQGVVHRDLKPANLMVQSGRAFVMDFGLAKATSVDSSLSASGLIVGTPAYMSPEQARGGAAGVTAASDVYSLGTTLYELLTGRPPFHAEDIYDLLQQVVDRDPEPPRRIKPSIDRDLETIVLKCLEKDPARRYRTARELAEELDRWLQAEPILAHPPSALYRVRKFVVRRKALVAIGAAGLAAVAVTAGLLVPRWQHERTLKELGPLRTQIAVVREWIRQPFRMPEEIQRALLAEIEGVSAYVERHPDLPQGYLVRAQAQFYRGDLREAERDAREALRRNSAFRPAWTLLGRVQLETYVGLLTVESVDPFKVTEEAARAVLSEARESLQRGRTEGDPRVEIETWGLARTADDAVSGTLAEALHLYYVQGSREEALRRLDEANRRSPSEEYCLWMARWLPRGEEQDRRIRETVEMAPLYIAGHVERGSIQQARGDHDEAVRSYARAIACDPRSVAAYVGRGLLRGEMEDQQGAIEDFTRALELDPRNTSAYIYRGAAQSMSGNEDGAIADCSKALEIHPRSVGALVNRSVARKGKKDYAGALEDLARAREINPKVPHAWANQAAVLHEMGRSQEALRDLSRAIDLDPNHLAVYPLRARLRRHLNDLDGAIEDYGHAIQRTPPRKTKVAAALYAERGMARLQKRDLDGGLADAKEALRLQPDLPGGAFVHASALLARGELEPAIREYSRAIELDPRQSDAWLGRGQAQLFRGRLAEVIGDTSRAIALEPTNVAAYVTRAVARQRQKDFRGAEEDCTSVLAITPEAAYAYLVRAQCRAALGRFPEAAADADKAQALSPAGSPQKETARKSGAAYRAGKLP